MSAKIVVALLVLAHLLTDFVFQSRKIAYQKGEDAKLLIQHCSYGLLISIILTLQYLSWWLVGIEILIYIIHFIIDGYKTKLKTINHPLLTGVRLFLIDQLIHLAVIIASYPLLKIIVIDNQMWSARLNLTNQDYYITILVIIVYILIWRPASFIVKKTLDDLEYDIGKNKFFNVEEIIGKLERFLFLTFILSNNFVAVAIIFLAKSVVFFSNFTDRESANYYIVRTLTSLVIAVVTGLILTFIISFEGYRSRFIFYQLI
ncbi:MAG: DUF3307 domain-containing protein [Bacillota bacterium]